MAYVGRALEDAGHKVEVLNIWQNNLSDEQVTEELKQRSFDVAGITALSTQYCYVKWLASEIRKQSDAKIVLGGALATFSSSLVLDNTDVDYCLAGEGETRIVELLSKELPDIKALYQGRQIADLDSIPFPAWHLFDMDYYTQKRRYYTSNQAYKSMNMITSRGCPWNCTFCSKVFSGVRLRSISNITEEIKFLQNKYGVECIKFDDELVMVSKQRMIELCEQLKPLNIHWVCQGRTNIVDKELLKTMKDAGCLAVGYGVESGSQTILNCMNKHILTEQNKQAILDTLDTGIFPIIQMMYGYPGENMKTLDETVAFFKDIPFTGQPIYLALTTALPGSELYEDCVKSGRIEDELAYLEGLASGYMRFGAGLRVNFTEFSDGQMLSLRDRTEKRILQTQIMRHPSAFVRQVWRKVWSNA